MISDHGGYSKILNAFMEDPADITGAIPGKKATAEYPHNFQNSATTDREGKMGFFNKLKNYVTGSSAKVTAEAVEPSFGGPFQVKIHAAVGETEVQIQEVYLKVVSLETVVIKDVEIARQVEDRMETVREDIEKTTVAHDEKIVVEGPQVLQANQEYDWEATVNLPENALPSFYGITARHEWKIMAGLSTSGNDPDSGWIVIHLA